ncbi:MAG: metallopeptidase family protein [Geminicoccaceae bacterium]
MPADMGDARGADKRFGYAPSADDIQRIGEAVLAELPPVFREPVSDVLIRVQEFPDDETVTAMACDSPFDLLGLYHGIPIGEREAIPLRAEVDVIYLYRRPILDYWASEPETLEHLVRHVLIHEIGHHFGLSDDDMAAIEAEADGWT